MSLTANDFGLQEENINISKLQGKTTNVTDGQKERDRGMECFMKKEDKSLIDVDTV